MISHRLSNKEGLRGDARISLGRGNRDDFAGRLEAGEIGNRRDQMRGGRKKGEMTGNWEHLGG